jgi:hypothetical protein
LRAAHFARRLSRLRAQRSRQGQRHPLAELALGEPPNIGETVEDGQVSTIQTLDAVEQISSASTDGEHTVDRVDQTLQVVAKVPGGPFGGRPELLVEFQRKAALLLGHGLVRPARHLLCGNRRVAAPLVRQALSQLS